MGSLLGSVSVMRKVLFVLSWTGLIGFTLFVCFVFKIMSIGDRFQSSRDGAGTYSFSLSKDQLAIKSDGNTENFDCVIRTRTIEFKGKDGLPRTVFYAAEWNRLEIIHPQTGETIDVLARDWLHLPPYCGFGGPFIFNSARNDMTPYPLILVGIEVLLLITVVVPWRMKGAIGVVPAQDKVDGSEAEEKAGDDAADGGKRSE